MPASTLLPLAVAFALSLLATTVHRRLPPKTAARTLVTTMIVVVGAAVPTLWLLSLGFLAHMPVLGRGARWCAEAFGAHERVPVWAGVGALLVSSVGAVRAWRVVHLHRLLRHDRPGHIEIVRSDDAFAYTLPGAGGRVVLSEGLVELLDESERLIVVAHEGAHAGHRHDRYVLVAQLADALLPPLRPLSKRLRFSLERWADEAAARQCGDRTRVATTLAKVALHGRTPAAFLGFTGLGVPARVAALLGLPSRTPHRFTILALGAAIAVTGCLAFIQLHHLSGLIAALCPD